MTLLLYLTLLSMTMSRSIHVAANGIISFSQWLSDGLYVPCLLYRLLCQQTLGFFHVLAIVQFCSDSGCVYLFGSCFFPDVCLGVPRTFIKGSFTCGLLEFPPLTWGTL